MDDESQPRKNATLGTAALGQLRRTSPWLLLLAVLALVVAWYARYVILVGFAGLLLSVFLYRTATMIQRWTKLPYWASLVLNCVLLLGLMVAIFWLIGARLASQVDQFQEQLPQAWSKFRGDLEQTKWGNRLIGGVHNATQSASQSGMLQRSAGALASSAQAIGGTLAIAFIGLFGAISPQLYVRGFMRLIPLPRRPFARELLEAGGDVLWWWILGQLAAMTFIGVLTWIAVWMLGVPLALTLAILAAILNFIPNFGPLLAAVPAILLALTVSPTTALWIAGLYVFIQLLQNNVVTPLVMQKAVKVPPAILLLAQLLMVFVAGILGMLLAPALTAVAVRWTDMAYVKRTLGDPEKRDKGFWPDGADAPKPPG